jgi:hypothetical protein
MAPGTPPYRVNYPPPPPPPRSNAAVIIVIVAVVVLVLFVLGGAAAFLAFRAGEKRGARTATSASAGSPDFPVAHGGTTTAPVNELAPPPGTFGESTAAKPDFAHQEERAQLQTTQYAPQLSKPLDVFLLAKPLDAEIERGFVICRFQTFNHADAFAGDDVSVHMKVGDAPYVTGNGPEDGNLAFVSAPLVTMKKGSPFIAEVFDRDVFELEVITNVSITWPGAALTFTNSGTSLECRQLTGDAHAHAVSLALGAADAHISKAGKVTPTPHSLDWGLPNLESIYAAIRDIAGLTGWADARAKKRTDAVITLKSDIVAKQGPIFDGLYKEASDKASTKDADVVLSGVTCNTEQTCEVKLRLTNKTKYSMSIGVDPSVYMATAKTGPVVPGFEQTDSVGANETAEVTLHSHKVPLGTEPSIIGFCTLNIGRGGPSCVVLKAH